MTGKLKLAVHELREGMFVAELDRPWQDTPFLFQGFVLRSEKEIREICRYCQFVWVDRGRSEVELEQPAANAENKRPSVLNRLLQVFSNETSTTMSSPADVIEQDTPMREELPRAGESIRHAENIVRDASDRLSLSETLEYSLVQSAVDPIIDSVLRNKDAMIWLQSMRGKSEYIFSRSVACAVWGVIFGRHLGLDRTTLSHLAAGGLLLDLGKVSIPDELLTRRGPLSEEEMDLVRRHVDTGVALLESNGEIDPVIIDMVRTHHERYNGTGYPHRLKGTEIPALGKIAGILDTFVAMTSQRPYADAMATQDVMQHLTELADVEFQGELVEQFIQAVGMFPTGSLVELSTGEVAIVTRQNRIKRLRPWVMIVTDANKQMLREFRRIDLREATTDDSGDHSLWIARGLPPGSCGIDPEEFFL
ncbi:MAG: DUF3391 domain-containing protein [Gammaproteobacteria bacterium]|nr:DUF3391 domain-containing protein [Gammaproteobacteria bacterium]